MESIVQAIIKYLDDEVINIEAIIGLGSVNNVFEVTGANGSYIIRLNEEAAKKIEYRKERWCIEKASSLGILSPKVLKLGQEKNFFFMIQEKIPGQNGKHCTKKEKEKIWEMLGTYAKQYHQINRIEDELVEAQEFHASWKARLLYNLEQLHDKDRLLVKGILNAEEHKRARIELSKLKDKIFQTGLIHADLSPRNVIWKNGKVHLLDWGLAGINIVPHIELGLVMTSEEANEQEIEAFKKGYGISDSAYQLLEKEMRTVLFLHHLDIYRWAEGNAIENIYDYEKKVQETFLNMTQYSVTKVN